MSNGLSIDNNYLLLFHFRIGLKRDMLFSSLHFHIAVKYAIRKVHENWEGLELDDLNYVLVYIGVYLLVKSINTIKSNEILLHPNTVFV
jgi:hypothetical protein